MLRLSLSCGLITAVLCARATFAFAAGGADGSGFALKDTPGDHLDVLLDGKVVGRYMYAHDTSTPERLHDTYKPYLHVFDAEGKAPITKGPGGLYTHHRGIFIGWNKITANGKTYDRWHMKDKQGSGEIVHQKFGEQKAGSDRASFTSVTRWFDEAGKPILEEERTTTFLRAAPPARLVIDFTSTLKPVVDVTLDGDPEHAGIHFRPANEVVAKETVYVFPKESADPKKDKDYPWVGETYTLNGKRHSVVQMNHPDNPKGTVFSAYRDYGRFGAFPKASIKAGDSLTLKYRFMIGDGEMPPIGVVQKTWDAFAGVQAATAAPKTTVIPVAVPKGK
jgi:methane monooxygenase PmoA-like